MGHRSETSLQSLYDGPDSLMVVELEESTVEIGSGETAAENVQSFES